MRREKIGGGGFGGSTLLRMALPDDLLAFLERRFRNLIDIPQRVCFQSVQFGHSPALLGSVGALLFLQAALTIFKLEMLVKTPRDRLHVTQFGLGPSDEGGAPLRPRIESII
jgi:hypothetical protein